MLCTQIVVLFWHSEQLWYTTCFADVASFWKRFTCILKDKFEWIALDPMTFFETWSTVPNLNEWFIEYEQRNKNIADQRQKKAIGIL